MARSDLSVRMIVPFLHYQHGGMETQALRLAKLLTARGVNVSFWSGMRIWERWGRYRSVLRSDTIDGIPVTWIPGLYPPHGNSIYPVELIHGVMKEARRRGPHPDILHGHELFSAGCAAARLSERDGIPAVVKIAGSGRYGDLAVLGRRPFARRKWKMFGAIRRFITLNNAMADELHDHGVADDRIVQIPNGVDTELFSPGAEMRSDVRMRLGVADVPTILTIGRIVPQKRFDLLIEAVSRIVQRIPTLQIIHLGKQDMTSDYGRNVRDALRHHGLETHVHFEGVRSDPQSWYRAADVFALPSDSEGLSNALLEAAASTCPIVATDIPGTRDVLTQNVDGILVPPGDAEALADGLLSVLTQPSIAGKMGTAARKRVQEAFSLDQTADRMMDLYEAVRSERARS